MIRYTHLLAAAVSLAAGLPTTALAAPAVDGEFPLTGQPGQLALGPDQNVWVVLSGGAGDDVARLAPDGTPTYYDDPDLANAVGIAAGPDGNLWLTKAGAVVRFAPADPSGTATSFPVAEIVDPRRIAAGGDALWTASADQAIRITTAGTATAFRVDGMGARGTTVAGDGRVWIADFGSQRLVSLAADGGDPQTLPVGGGPQEVGAGAGAQIAYANPGAIPHEVGLVGPPAQPSRLQTPGTDPFGIAFGDDGAYWIANFASSTLTRLTTDGAITSLSGLRAGSGPRWIARGGGGTLWVALETARAVARVSGVTAPPVDPPRPPVEPPRPPVEPPRPPEGRPRAPASDTRRPTLARLRLGARRIAAGRRVTLRFRLDEAGTATVRLSRRAPGRRRFVAAGRARRRAVRRGANAIALGRLRTGRWRIALTVRDAAGNARAARPLTLVVVRPRR